MGRGVYRLGRAGKKKLSGDNKTDEQPETAEEVKPETATVQPQKIAEEPQTVEETPSIEESKLVNSRGRMKEDPRIRRAKLAEERAKKAKESSNSEMVATTETAGVEPENLNSATAPTANVKIGAGSNKVKPIVPKQMKTDPTGSTASFSFESNDSII